MQYSTIQEAYNIDCLKPSKKSSKSSSQNINIVNNSSPPYNIENNSVASNKESVNYNNSVGGVVHLFKHLHIIYQFQEIVKKNEISL